jgi:hypothetical protein
MNPARHAPRTIFAAAIAATLAACGSPAATSDPDAGTDAAPGTSEPVAYLRLSLEQTATGVQVRDAEPVTVALPRSPAAAGGYAVIGWQGTTAVVVQPFTFATRLVKEGFGDDGGPEVGTRSDVAGAATMLVPIGGDRPVDRITVVDPAGATVVDQPIAAMHLAPAPPPSSSHLLLIEPSQRALIPAGFGGEADYTVQSIAALPAAKRQEIFEAIAILPPRVQASVTTIIVAKLPNDGVEEPRCTGGRKTKTLAQTIGGFIMINATVIDDARLPQIIAHEAGHSYTFALSPDDADALPANLPAEVNELAADTMRENLLGDGFLERWDGLHKTAVTKQMAGPYSDGSCPGITVDEAHQRGFVSKYGATDAYEDIAEWTQQLATPQEPPLFCDKLRAVGNAPLPKELVIPYVKLLLLDGAGFVMPGRAAACYGDLAVHGPKGIHLNGDDGKPALSLTSELKGGWIHEDNADFLIVLGAGPSTYKISLRVLAPGKKPPIGLHDLASIGWDNLNAANNAVYLSNDNLDRVRTSAGGLVLVSEVSANRIEMSVFMLQLQNEYGDITDTFPMSTFVYEP